MDRRAFLRAGAVGAGGLGLAVAIQGCGAPALDAPPGVPFAPNPWLRVLPDGSVRIVGDRAEMGQGITTGYAVLIGEELDVDPSTIRYEFAPAHEAYYNRAVMIAQMTGGSTGMTGAWQPVRAAAATARAMLVAAAARRWGVDPATCETADGAVRHPPSGRVLGYGALATAAAAEPPPERVTLKPPARWRWIGKEGVRRIDAAAHARGASVFGLDARPKDALVAVIARPPVVAGGSVVSFDASKALRVPGVKHVVQVSSGVAVVADTTWAALEGRKALQVTFDDGPMAGFSTAAQLEAYRALLASGEARVLRRDGDARAAVAGAARRVSAQYEVPYLAHATMEPMNATARVTADRCDVWAPTQLQDARVVFRGGARRTAARVAGLSKEQVFVHTMHLGGGFGRRAEVDFVVDAVETAKATGAAVQVVWTREDDMRHDWYRPAAVAGFEAGLGPDGLPVGCIARVVSASIFDKLLPGWVPDWVALRANPPGGEGGGLHASTVEGIVERRHAFGAFELGLVLAPPTVPIGWWRSVGHSGNAFFLESFVDELAHAAGQDPLAYRLALLARQAPHVAVLTLVAERSGWGSPPPPGRARGVAVHESFGSVVAQVAEVSLEGGRPRVHRVTVAADCGLAVLPDAVRAQMESSVLYGLSAALAGEITIERGRVRQSNFHDYAPLRMAEAPVVDVHLVPGGDTPSGAGEPGLPPIAPAVANALFALTGQRLRRLPLRLEGVA